MQEFLVVTRKGVEIFKSRAKAGVAAMAEGGASILTYSLDAGGWLYYDVSGIQRPGDKATASA